MDAMILITQKWLNNTYKDKTGYNPLDLSDEKIRGKAS